MTPGALVRVLRSGLFDGVDEALIEQVLARAHPVAVPAGALVVREGDRAEDLFIVLDGELEVSCRSDDGADLHLDVIGPGAHFGEQALMAGAPLTRNASVRAKGPAAVLRLGAAQLHALMEQDSSLRRRLERLRRRYLDNRIARRTALLRELLRGTPEPRRLILESGEVLYRQDDPVDALYVVLEGGIKLLDERGGAPVLRAGVGPGLSVGEADAQHRAYTAVAEGRAEVFAFPRAALEEASARSRGVRDQLAVMERVWELPQRGFVTWFLGDVDGAPCLTQLYRLRGGEQLVVTQLIGAEELRLERVDAQGTQTLTTPEGAVEVSLDPDGTLVGLVARRRVPLLARLLSRAIDGQPLSPPEQEALARAGELGDDEAGFLCACVRVPRARVEAAIADGAHTLDALQRVCGAGLVCGACVPALHEALGEQAFLPVRVGRVDSPTADTRRVSLEPREAAPLPDALPGQHVVLRATIAGRVVSRPYTLSGAAGGPWEITVKQDRKSVV